MGTTVLLADDSITIQKVVGIIFANEDYELVVVDNGNDALEKAREIRPAVMLVDALMPDKSGYEVCEEIRRDPALKATPLLLLVGAFEPFEEDKARASGIDDYITKPFESQNLLEKVHALLELGVTRAVSAPGPEEEVSPSFDEIPPVETPVEAPPVSANLIEPFRAFVNLGADDAVRKEAVEIQPVSDTTKPAVAEAETEGIIVLSSVDIVEAGPEDDPWGSFDEDESIRFGEVLDEDQPGLADMVEEIEPFTLMEEPGDMAEIQPEQPAPEEEDAAPGDVCVPEADEPFVFADEPESVAFSGFSLPEPPVSAPPAGERIFLGEMPVETTSQSVAEVAIIESHKDLPGDEVELATEETELRFAPEEEYVPAVEACADMVPPVVAVTPAGEEAPITLSEEQLASALSRISREMIEKIVWDVVPDLAETIIREEIRRIKEGIGR